MTRDMKRFVLIGLTLLALMALMLPMRIVFDWSGLGKRGISARSVDGSIWSGTIRDLYFGKLALGDMDAQISPGGLLRGDLALSMARASDAAGQPPLAFDIARSGNGVSMRDATGDVPAGDLFAPLPVRSITLDAVNATIADDRCASASGVVRINIEQSLFGVSLQRGLTGTIRCDGGDLLVPLKGQSGMEVLDIRIGGDGRYTADFRLGGLAPGLGSALGALGFQQQGDAMAIRINGRF
ncbi:type II secretion system protein N [Blastomonas sp.]|uniref:type II secretion system protein N n=1 Tax=Blastomonas sp. TaxID=1909299 RepID=UPI003593F50D